VPPACAISLATRWTPGGVHVHHGHLRALAGEAERAGAAHAGRGGGHDPDLSGEAHGESSITVVFARRRARGAGRGEPP
jgi:hypothetical protein